MIRTMSTAVNTMSQLQHQLDIIGNNLANSSTNGYKSNEAKFQELLYQQFNNDKADQAPRRSEAGIRLGVGAMLGQTQMNWKVGSIQVTDRQLDFALTSPKQYFNLITPTEGGEEIIYTRKGNFYISPLENGQAMLVNDEGYPVANSAGQPIVFADQAQSFNVLPNGVLEVTQQNGAVQRFELGVSVLEKPNAMVRLSATNFGLPANMAELGIEANDLLTELIGGARGEIGMQNRALEASNVNYEKEMTDLITTQRAYQFNARSVTLADQMLGLINGIR